MGSRIAPRQASVPETSPRVRIDVDVAPDKLSVLFARIKEEWESMGASEPHWSVLTDDRYRPGNLAPNLDAFYASGKTDVDRLLAYLNRNRIDKSKMQTCFELGCGVGRITGHLASHFPAVTAADISTNHLIAAGKHLGTNRNISLKLFREVSDVSQLGNYDLFFSVIVLQHNPPPVIKWMLTKILENLNPGGVGFFQIPSYFDAYQFDVDAYIGGGFSQCGEIPWFDRAKYAPMEVHPLPQHEVFKVCAQTCCSVLEVREDDSFGYRQHALSNTYLVQKHMS
jgi:SAM-dependent methyltransferase